ncbi:ribosome hibernation-promoting factor, HPF/YfiA family [Arsenicicoccus dermatophilus]|uniref:ribosome hibernation-promoting factor, HPF/YfiA family n=1 Tax=Arsenicicoccus dermatophilus TaxID=1076331 RepID=UPI001F4C94C8|nr:ribosome-associated translation inhibitor RaiA [Arsenicicoccus dermatophilus]MCH8613593.1 ribosome-associated translation inhibitor RaiA [Arsenicicoccus dermatophilus]
MDIQITGRHLPVTDAFREHVHDRLGKLEPFVSRDPRVDVIVAKQASATAPDAITVEITCRTKGPVVRAEATGDDKEAAFDTAATKLLDRLKKAADRRRGQRRRVTTSTAPDLAVGPFAASVLTEVPAPAPEAAAPAEATVAEPEQDPGPEVVELPDTPIEVRVKHHRSAPMTLEQALDQMELVGHDFYLYTDAETGAPSVLYRRRGWSYGVLHLDTEQGTDVDEESAVEAQTTTA